MASKFKTVGLFAGVGGLELGLESAGAETVGLCEIEPSAKAVLQSAWSDVPIWSDVRTLKSVPRADVITAGFPCQDLSQAGKKAGISGSQSGLVEHVLRLMAKRNSPRTLVLENVSYMLSLDSGHGMSYLVNALEDLGLKWAYRVVDARSFGIPQRRQRVLMVASRELDPSLILLTDDHGSRFDTDDSIGAVRRDSYYGFYWTEGLRGLGWARESVPTVKGGSALGIPSPPAIWVPRRNYLGTPTIRDAERLQGFDSDWTKPATLAGHRDNTRWKLVGNAVCVPMASWLGRRLVDPGSVVVDFKPWDGKKWPTAAFGERGKRFAAYASVFPEYPEYKLSTFLDEDLKPLSIRATQGFLDRARRSKLRFANGFLDGVETHLARMEREKRS